MDNLNLPVNTLREVIAEMIARSDPALSNKFLSVYPEATCHRTMNDELNWMQMFWRIQIGKLLGDTVAIREYLETDVSVDVWLTRFQTHVLPCILQNKLPQ